MPVVLGQGLFVAVTFVYQFAPPRRGRTKIADARKPEPGRVLCEYGDPSLGTVIREATGRGRDFPPTLVEAAADHIEFTWDPTPAFQWVTAVPSLVDHDPVTAFAARLAAGLGFPFVPALRKVESPRPQRELANAYQKRWNVAGVFEATDACRPTPVLLVDDTVNSRWTLREASITLRDADSDPFYPFVLAKCTRH